MIALLANQSIQIHNLRHKDDPKPLVTAEELELLTTPIELSFYRSAIMEAMFRGTKRNVEAAEDETKNAETG